MAGRQTPAWLARKQGVDTTLPGGHNGRMKPVALTEAEIADLARSLPGWAVQDGMLVRDFRFADFSGAWAFMSQVALLAEEQDHHPNWSNVYDRVHIALTTHDAGGLTGRDTRLARAINRLL